jgi:hypothetical protein
MQGWYLYILRYSVSIFDNSVSILIIILGLSGYNNRYRATIAMTCNSRQYRTLYIYSQLDKTNALICQDLLEEPFGSHRCKKNTSVTLSVI